ncbi:hypothetical protein HPB48_015666 [Haemaphysalis longicornis]|uniref:FP protein C-terminal domain-containing protein n=1 Tax=Haemaphysalis longicornis TaxID=44386 RepID=A0A9J6FM26_HAELO|nr:hypothetical protein HPB48_015666 [Haemaphysalis longicornis]
MGSTAEPQHGRCSVRVASVASVAWEPRHRELKGNEPVMGDLRLTVPKGVEEKRTKKRSKKCTKDAKKSPTALTFLGTRWVDSALWKSSSSRIRPDPRLLIQRRGFQRYFEHRRIAHQSAWEATVGYLCKGRTTVAAQLVKARKQKLTTKQLGLSQANAVYVNEHLTQANKQLLGAAIARKKEVAWKFVWTSGGKVFARKDEQMDCCEDTGLV